MIFKTLYKGIVLSRWKIGAILGIFHSYTMYLVLFEHDSGVPPLKFLMCLLAGLQAILSFAGAVTFLPLSFAPKSWLETDKEGQVWLKRTGVEGNARIPCFRLFSLIIGLSAAFFYVICLLGSIETLTKSAN